MSKKIPHEQARQHLEDKIKDGDILTVLEYIKQQEKLELEYDLKSIYDKKILGQIIEKQSKLLKLYKEALETNFEGITLIKLVNKTLRTQIKELENEER